AGTGEHGLELAHPRLDGDQLRAALDHELRAEVIAAVQLERQPTEIAEALLAEQQQRAALTPQLGCGQSRRSPGEQGHAGDCMGASRLQGCVQGRVEPGPYSWMTTRRSSVISR